MSQQQNTHEDKVAARAEVERLTAEWAAKGNVIKPGKTRQMGRPKSGVKMWNR